MRNFEKRGRIKLGANQKKILLLLAGGVGLSLAGSPRRYFKVIKEVSDEWQKINDWALKRAIKALYRSKLLREIENDDGSTTMVLSENGKKKAITFNLDTIEIKRPARWDKLWRIVLFDIPEKKKPAREALRETIKKLGFHEYQKSVFIFPYPCQKEIDYVIEFFELRPYVRVIIVKSLDNELHLKHIFRV
ncbi:MAG: hypothetical protein AAB946_00995 [Patescibacteria group bacterium]